MFFLGSLLLALKNSTYKWGSQFFRSVSSAHAMPGNYYQMDYDKLKDSVLQKNDQARSKFGMNAFDIREWGDGNDDL